MHAAGVVTYRIQVIRSYNRFGGTFVEREVDTTYYVERGEAFDPAAPPVLDDARVMMLLDIAAREQWPPLSTDVDAGVITGRALVAHLNVVATAPGGRLGSDRHIEERVGTVFRWVVRDGAEPALTHRSRRGYHSSRDSAAMFAFALGAIQAKAFPGSTTDAIHDGDRT